MNKRFEYIYRPVIYRHDKTFLNGFSTIIKPILDLTLEDFVFYFQTLSVFAPCNTLCMVATSQDIEKLLEEYMESTGSRSFMMEYTNEMKDNAIKMKNENVLITE